MSEQLLAVGRVARAHGIKGEVAVERLTEVERRFAAGSRLRLEDGRKLTVEAARPHRRRLLVKFEEVADRAEAQSLRGQILLVPADDAPSPPEGAFWVHDVVGLEVMTEGGRSLGRVREVQWNPANDLWVTDSGALVPAVRAVVVVVDIDAGRVTIRDVPGLVQED